MAKRKPPASERVEEKCQASLITGDVLSRFPVSIFGSVMGFSGLTRAFRASESVFGIDKQWGNLSGITAILTFVLLLGIFSVKITACFSQVKSEFINPATGAFYATLPIAILLLSTITDYILPYLYSWLWCIGSVLMLSLAFFTCYKLLNARHDPLDIQPGLILPVVGVLNITVTGGRMTWYWAHEVMLLAFATGAGLTAIFFTLIFSRLIHNERLSKPMEPTLMILMSPFAVCCLAYVSITGKMDLFAVVLYYLALFLFFILIFRVFVHQRSFIHTWWSLAFPIAALANASLKYASFSNNPTSVTIAALLMIILTTLVVYMLTTSIYLAYKNRLY